MSIVKPKHTNTMRTNTQTQAALILIFGAMVAVVSVFAIGGAIASIF